MIIGTYLLIEQEGNWSKQSVWVFGLGLEEEDLMAEAMQVRGTGTKNFQRPM